MLPALRAGRPLPLGIPGTRSTATAREQLCGARFPDKERTRNNGKNVFFAVRAGAI
jgi:hypothetical protein